MSAEFFKWDNIRKLRTRPKLSLLQQQLFGPIIDGFPTEPDPEPGPDILCLQSPVTVTVVDNKYSFGPSLSAYGMTSGTYRFSVPEEHPIAFLNKDKIDKITYFGIQYVEDSISFASREGYGYIYVYGDVYVTVTGDFDKISYVCLYHGYEGGQDNLYYKDSCVAPPARNVTCLVKDNNLVVTADGEIKIGDTSAPYGLTLDMYNINFDLTSLESGPGLDLHELVFLTNGVESNVLGIEGNFNERDEENDLPVYKEGVSVNVYDSFGNIGVMCRNHPNERIDDFFIFSPSCVLPLPDDYEYIIPEPPTVIECLLRAYFDEYGVCDKDGTFYESSEYDPSFDNQNRPSFTVTLDTFPYTIFSSFTGITYIAKGIYTEVATGDYKITDAPSGIFPSGYYLLVDVDGDPVFNTAVTPQEFIGIAWNGSTSFPFSGTGIRQSGTEQVISTSVSYTIIGQILKIIPNCRIKQPKIGTYTDSTIYLISNADGVELNDSILEELANTSDIKARVFWTTSDEFPKVKPGIGGSGLQYSILAFYKELDPVFYKAKQSKLGEYSSQNVYTLVKSDNTDKMDPGTNNTTLVTITLPSELTDQEFPVIKTPTSLYKVVDYQISTLFYVNVVGEYRLKQIIVNNLPDPYVYFIVDSNGDLVDDPGTNNTTKVQVRWTGGAFPVKLTSTKWRVNLYTIVGKYSETTGDYIIQSTPTTSVDHIYILQDLRGNLIDDPGTNNTSQVSVYWKGDLSTFPLYLNSQSGFFGITYIVIAALFPKFVTIEEYTGPTGPVTEATGPGSSDGFYFSENINPPSGTAPSELYTGPTTFVIDEIITEATGAFEGTNTSSINAVVAGPSSLYTLNTASEWLAL
jgi:hypothetical protein